MQLITKTWVNRVYKDTLTPAERRPIIETVDRCREVAWFKRGSHFSHGVARRHIHAWVRDCARVVDAPKHERPGR